MGEAVLVIDFGTSTSSAALVSSDGRVRLIKEPGSGSWSWPSAVCADGDRLLVGTTAERRKRTDPASYRAEFKRDLGQQAPIPLGDRDYPVSALVTALLAAFREQAGEPVRRALLTVPASYRPGDPRRALMIAAAEAAGFDDVELLAEPVAAALAPLSGEGFGAGDTVLVYDFGGGTFDAALVRFGGDSGNEVLGHAALDDCGGRDIDALLIGHVRDSGGAELAEALAVPAGAARAVRMRLGLQFADFARGIKHQLSDVTEVEDFVSHLAPPSRVERAELTALVAPVLARTVDCCRELLRGCSVAADAVTAVLLVGGTSRMPVVADTVARELGRPIRRPEDPDLAVVQGAAAHAEGDTGRVLLGMLEAPGRSRLRWHPPAGSSLSRILIDAGEKYAAGAPMAVARDSDDLLWTLTAGSAAGTVRDWIIPAGALLSATDWPVTVTSANRPIRLHRSGTINRVFDVGDARSVAFSPDGRWLAGGGRGVRVWDHAERRLLLTLSGSTGYLLDPVRFSPDGRRLAAADREFLQVWDLATGDRMLSLEHSATVDDVNFSSDGRWMVTASDGAAVIWEVATGARVRTMTHEYPREDFRRKGSRSLTERLRGRPAKIKRPNVYTVAFSPDTSVLVTGSNEVHLWDVANGEQLGTFGNAGDVAVSPDGQQFATAGYNPLNIWTNGPEHAEAAGTRMEANALALDSTDYGWECPVFSPDGRFLAVGWARSIRIFDAQSRGRLDELAETRVDATVRSLDFSPEGEYIAAAYGNHVAMWTIGVPVDET
ncbi:WD40 repeat protein/actin-like ATPase involved in cell morphogenesis [Actinoplanes tereljensis]|uniref:Hsp70 family protein n=1 Tax=Paractinoplanes tereljensis TaxID=571912 RepID=UPI0019452E36|nr:Hsp70 family protein [Actinoplanes tereljensis]